MNCGIYANELCFVAGRSNQLTLSAQENLKKRLLVEAQENATHDLGHDHHDDKVHRHYYDALATFMNAYPAVLIDLVLIKLDQHSLN